MAEPDLAVVGLVPSQQVLLQPGCLADAQQQQPFGHRIESPGVTDSAFSRSAFRAMSTTSWEVGPAVL